ncbi:MAG: LysE family transporter [Candidatus Dependentiae bacterium]|nr:LysE family transporter [Candidatus Dependentiae bacterium]
MLTMFLKGLGIGLTISAIVGPIAIMCIRRTLSDGQRVGLAIALGAALGDAMYGTIAAFSLTFISDFLLAHQAMLRFIGGIFLLAFGIKIFFETTKPASITVHGHRLLNIIIGTFFLTISNPITILSFTAIFASLGVGTEQVNYTSALSLVGGIFIGAMTWNIILTSILVKFRTHITPRVLHLINQASGGIIAGFGVLSLFSLLIA